MLYETLDAGAAPRKAEAPDTLGYLYNHGGLNNQKMAILGLLLGGVRQRQPVTVPYIYNKDQRTEAETLARFEDIFDPAPITEFTGAHGVPISLGPPTGSRGGWDWFRAFNAELENPSDPASFRILLDAAASLKPRIATTDGFKALKQFAFGSLGIDTTVQLRIEADWREHVAQALQPRLGHAEDNGIGFAEIMTKVRNTFPGLRMVYVTADEASMPVPKDAIRAACRTRFGLEPVWKTDLLPDAFRRRLTPLDLSLIDFEMARACPRFVGLTTSTFANMLALEKLAETRQPVRGHYIYNHPGETVLERQDNGLATAAARAVQPLDPAVPLVG
ncbi:MAG TPA: hypothetical protein VE690_10350 [Rhodopila sp.]|nr:hypothetical protein [Rhodopila sp.]